MNYKETESGITALLDGTLSLRKELTQSPQVTHIPFMGTRENFFLLVNIKVRPEANNKQQLVSMCLAAAQMAIGSGCLTDEKAVEISAFIDVDHQENQNLKRVFRLGVKAAAFVQAMHIGATDLLNETHTGITCQWPRQIPQ
jgi:hypothetical protein